MDRVLDRQRRLRRRWWQGVRSTDIAKELALKAPLSLGHARTLDGQAVDAIDGTQTFGHKSAARRPLRPGHGNPRSGGGGLGERQGKAHDAEHIVYSKWGEQVRPEAPKATISIGSISAV